MLMARSSPTKRKLPVIGANLKGLGVVSRSPIQSPTEWGVVRLSEITLKIGSGATPTGGKDSCTPEVRAGQKPKRFRSTF